MAVIAAQQLAKIGRDQTDANGKLIRLRMEFSIDSTPLRREDMENMPGALARQGITEEEWKKWRNILVGINKARLGMYKKKGAGSLFKALNPFAWFEDQSAIDWNKQLQQWQADFNATVLIPRGVYCKTKSHSWSSQQPVYKDGTEQVIDMQTERMYRREIHFAFTPDEQRSLKSEPHLTGEVYMREKYFVMHP